MKSPTTSHQDLTDAHFLTDSRRSETTTEKPSGRLAAILSQAGIRINPPNPEPWDLIVRDEKQFAHRILSPFKNGLTELGDMYVDGVWECEDIAGFFHRCLSSGLNARFYHAMPNVLQYWAGRLLNRQTKPRAARDIASHYNLGPVFEITLDPTMAYTCAYWKEGVSNLAEAQFAKYDLCCRKLGLEPGMNLLDTGCGWGGLLKHAAEHHGIGSGLGVTLSKDQVAIGMERCQGLPVTLLLKDYRDVEGKFDRVSSIGMTEHVGPKNYRAYCEKVHDVLKPGGLFLLHTFGNINPSPTLRTPEVEWVTNHIFPGLVNPSYGQIAAASDGLFTLLDVQEFGAYYDPTLIAWHDNFVAGWPSIKHLYDERFYRKWRYYLQICAGAFRSGHFRLWQTVFGKDYAGVYQAVR
ncbi:MAG: cyclopropane fatty acyl phospholipid synthase [Verrucomicrobiota bacterium]